MQKPVDDGIPFQRLGSELKALRQKLQESVAEVSGAVEIDIELLELIEHGAERPSEDVLMLLISHFNIADDDAVELWQLAGYDKPEQIQDKISADNEQGRAVVVMMTLDTRVLYSDNVSVATDKNGVVLNFLQGAGISSKNQQVPIARIGMSYEQAHDFLRQLSHGLTEANKARQPKELPAPNPKNKKPNLK